MVSHPSYNGRIQYILVIQPSTCPFRKISILHISDNFMLTYIPSLSSHQGQLYNIQMQ